MNVLEALKHIAEHGGEAYSTICRFRVRLCNNGIFRKKLDLQSDGPWNDKDYPLVMNMTVLNSNDWTVPDHHKPAAPPPESPKHEEASLKTPTFSNAKYE